MPREITKGETVVFRLRGETVGIVADIRKSKLPLGGHRTDYIIVQPDEPADFKFHRYAYHDRYLDRMAVKVQGYQIRVTE